MIKWTKTGKEVSLEGTTITYKANTECPLEIQSRKRHIPHANGKPGTWDHTSYFVVFYGKDVIEKQSLQDAKDYAEENYGKD